MVGGFSGLGVMAPSGGRSLYSWGDGDLPLSRGMDLKSWGDECTEGSDGTLHGLCDWRSTTMLVWQRVSREGLWLAGRLSGLLRHVKVSISIIWWTHFQGYVPKHSKLCNNEKIYKSIHTSIKPFQNQKFYEKTPQLIRKNTAWRNALGKANHNSFHLFGGLWIHELCFHKRIIKNTLCISHREIKCTKWLASAVVNPIHKDYQRGSAYLRNTLQHLDNYHSTPSHSSILMKKPLTDDRELSKIVITLS